jgi:hypothetical protein
MATEIYTPPQLLSGTESYTHATENPITLATGTALYEDPNKVVFLGDVQLVGNVPTVEIA